MSPIIATSTIFGSASDDTRELWSIVALLAVVGIGLAMLSVWLLKTTRPDREALAPLEVMGQRKWRRSDPVWQRRQLDAVRPPGAEPLSPSRTLPVPDEAFDAGPQAPGFDDLEDRDDDPADETDQTDGDLVVDVTDDLPPELAEVVATSLEAEVDHDATPPSVEQPVVALESVDEPDTPDDPTTAWPDPSTDAPVDDLSPPHGLTQREEG